MTTYTDIIGRNQLTGAARDYYAAQVKNEQRDKCIIGQFVRETSDPSTYETKKVIYTRVYDVSSNIAALTELSDVIPHSWLDSDTVYIGTQEYGHSMRHSKYLQMEAFWRPEVNSIVRDRLGRHYTVSTDRQALNEYLTAESEFTAYVHYGSPTSAATSRATLEAVTADYADTEMVEQALLALETRNVSESFSDPSGGIVMLCHPFVLADVRNDTGYETAAYYAGAAQFFRGYKPPLWNGVIPIVSTRMRLPLAGDYTEGNQTTLTAAANGMSAGPLKVIAVAATTGMHAGDIIAIHPAADGNAVLNTSATLEYAEIASIADLNVTLKRPLNHDHASGAYVTVHAPDLFPVVFLGTDWEGGETVVRGETMGPQVYAFTGNSLADPVGRYVALAWYGIYGYDLISPWNMEIYIVRSSKSAKQLPMK